MRSQITMTSDPLGTKMNSFSPYILGLSLTLAACAAMAAPASVGKVDFAKGQVSAQNPNMGSRGLAAQANIYGQDLVVTGDQSFSVLRFLDKGKVSIRPLSRFAVSSYGGRLDQGSLEVDAGSRLTVNTKLAKVDASQAKLEVRVCKQDCNLGRSAAVDSRVAAKVVSKTGQASANGRALAAGSALYESDTLSTGANSQLLAVFRDGGRISMGANSEVNIKAYRYAQAGNDRSSLQLIKGSLRALTGKIGKSNPDNYAIGTPVATIGVRGTNFDLVYPVNVKGQRGAAKGLLAQVRQGAISQQNGAGTFGLSAGKVNYIGGQGQAPKGLATPPAAMLQALGLKPETARIDLEQMFGTQHETGLASGTYVHVQAGQASFTSQTGESRGQSLTLSKGQSAFVDQNGRMQVLEQSLGAAPFVAMPQVEEVIERPEIPFIPLPDIISMPTDDYTHSFHP